MYLNQYNEFYKLTIKFVIIINISKSEISISNLLNFLFDYKIYINKEPIIINK